MRVVFLPNAVTDLEGIGDYIARDNPRRARSFVTDLRRQCAMIGTNPMGYRARSELADGIRSCTYGNYVIFFKVELETLLIVRILHGAMDIDSRFSTSPEQ